MSLRPAYPSTLPQRRGPRRNRLARQAGRLDSHDPYLSVPIEAMLLAGEGALAFRGIGRGEGVSPLRLAGVPPAVVRNPRAGRPPDARCGGPLPPKRRCSRWAAVLADPLASRGRAAGGGENGKRGKDGKHGKRGKRGKGRTILRDYLAEPG